MLFRYILIGVNRLDDLESDNKGGRPSKIPNSALKVALNVNIGW
jgi:hypothetical protein